MFYRLELSDSATIDAGASSQLILFANQWSARTRLFFHGQTWIKSHIITLHYLDLYTTQQFLLAKRGFTKYNFVLLGMIYENGSYVWEDS